MLLCYGVKYLTFLAPSGQWFMFLYQYFKYYLVYEFYLGFIVLVFIYVVLEKSLFSGSSSSSSIQCTAVLGMCG